MTTIEKLLVLQERDRTIRQLAQESVDIPARKQLIETRLKNHREAVAKAQDELKKNSAGIKQVELEVDARRQKILKLRDQQGSIKTNQEYKAIEHEVASLQKQISEIEDREMELMESTEALKAKLAEAEQVLKREQSFVDGDMKNLDTRLAVIEGEIVQAKAAREKVVPDIDPEWLARYQRILNHTGNLAIVPVEGVSCGGCHMRLPPQQIQDAKRAERMVPCSFCGRLLFVPQHT